MEKKSLLLDSFVLGCLVRTRPCAQKNDAGSNHGLLLPKIEQRCLTLFEFYPVLLMVEQMRCTKRRNHLEAEHKLLAQWKDHIVAQEGEHMSFVK